MKKELATAIGAAIFGVIASYLICNLFIGEIQPVTFSTVDETVTTDLASPSPEVFNYKALNPTVEVYVGDCAEFDISGNCITGTTGEGDQ